MKFDTKTIHGGQTPDPATGAIMPPIYQTTTYVQDAPGVHKGYEYARSQNPTRNALQHNLAALENASDAICFSSGMAAIDSILRLLSPGDEIIATQDLYGGTYRLMSRVHDPMGGHFRYIDMTDPTHLRDAITQRTKMIWLESPTNPVLSILDIEQLCTIAHEHDIMVCVDNTFCSPYLQNPLDLGADIVMHSASKYLSGHSDVIHGCAITNNKEIADRLRFIQNAVGAIPGPMDCYLVLRGIKTMHLRVERACQNAQQIAEHLQNHPKIDRVLYPGLSQHPNHDVAKRQMKMYGAVVAIDLATDDLVAAQRVMSRTKLFALSESLGGVESQIGHPATMSHVSVPKETRYANGISDSLLRLSVGVEHVDDLIADIDHALFQE